MTAFNINALASAQTGKTKQKTCPTTAVDDRLSNANRVEVYTPVAADGERQRRKKPLGAQLRVEFTLQTLRWRALKAILGSQS